MFYVSPSTNFPLTSSPAQTSATMAGGGGSDKEPTLPYLTYSIGHELGILFGFAAIMLLATGIFAFVWVKKNKRQARLESERQAELREKGFGMDGWMGERVQVRKASLAVVQTESRGERRPSTGRRGSTGRKMSHGEKARPDNIRKQSERAG